MEAILNNENKNIEDGIDPKESEDKEVSARDPGPIRVALSER